MQKRRNLIVFIICFSLCAALIAITIFSGTLTKYATTSGMRALARVAKWGIDIDAGSDLSKEIFASNGKLVVSAKNSDNIIVPGSTGSLAYVRTSGTPEVAYNVDISGGDASGDVPAFTVGSGYYASSKLLRGSDGKPMEYFPIIIRFCVYDLASNGDKIEVQSSTYGIAGHGYAPTVSCANLTDLVAAVNSAFNEKLDTTNNSPAPNGLNRVYTVDWIWQYKPADNSYQTNTKDTTLCEAIKLNNSDFDISVNMYFEMMQAN